MIQNIVRHCTRTVYQHKMNAFLNLSSVQSTKFYFATENAQQKQPKQKKNSRQEEVSDFSPMDYYRNTIRRVNIRTNGRGNFTPYFLQKIINMSTTEDHAKIMYEAYYNYMGHFTLIPNKVVDSLVFKSIEIGNQVDKVLQIFSHHNYLAYFPHYEATSRFIKHLVTIKDQQNLQKMLRVIVRSPLIKINAKIVNQLITIASSEEAEGQTRQYVLKILLFRRNLVEGIGKDEVLSKVAEMLESVDFGPYEGKPMVKAAIQELLSEPVVSQQDTVNRLMLTSTFSLIQNCASIISQEQQQITTQYDRLFNHLIKLSPRTEQQVNFGTILKEALAEAKLSLGATEKIQQIVNAKTPAEASE